MSSANTPICVSPEMERAVLGASIMWGSFLLYAELGLTRADFFKHVHRQIWDACEGVSASGATPDFITVTSRLRERGELDEVSAAYLASLGDGVPRPAVTQARYHVAKLRELSTLRQLLLRVEQFQLSIQDTRSYIEDGVAQAFASDLESILEGAQIEQMEAWTGGQLHDAYAIERARGNLAAVWWGISPLDEVLQGMRIGEVCGVQARPGVGKTVLLSNLHRSVSGWGHNNVCFSLEMPGGQLAGRMLQQTHSMTRHQLEERFDRGLVDRDETERELGTMTVIDKSGLSIPAMRRYVRQQKRMGREITCVSIDHLSLIGGNQKLSTYDRMSLNAREIKAFAKDERVCIVVLMHPSREAGGLDGSKKIGLGAARDSGVIEEALDYIIGVRRFDRCDSLPGVIRQQYENVLFLTVPKNRHGQPFSEEIAVRYNYQLQVEVVDMLPPDMSDAGESSVDELSSYRGRRRRY
jgi:replicative DNA helicase